MSFSDHKITAFTHRIADLPDQPNLPADELKARFDSSPEELRVAHNAVCDDADRLEARVEGIVAETFGDAIDKEMLSTELAAELDAKATQTALAAEQTAREGADASLQTTVSQKCEVYVGTYTGNTAFNNYGTQKITLGFKPKLVWVVQKGFKTDANQSGYVHVVGGIATDDWDKCGIKLLDDGFQVTENHSYDSESGFSSTQLNLQSTIYIYFALK
mgnify:FL=1